MIKKLRKKVPEVFSCIMRAILFSNILLHIESVITILKDLDEEL